MRFASTELPGVLVVEPRVFEDERGFFWESYHQSLFREAGITDDFVQDNHSYSYAGVIRGLHYQLGLGGGPGQAKLVRVVSGRVLDVALDVRRGSPHFGRWLAVELSAENHRSVYIPAGFAHGYYTYEDSHFLYKCSDVYRPELERGIAFNDPSVGIQWSTDSPKLSERDAGLPRLGELEDSDLPRYAATGE